MTNKSSVLIVEDETGISDFLSAALRENGYRPLTAENGSTAVSMISSHCPDVVLLDLGLPDMDGIEVLRFLRSWSTDIPVLVVSARSEEEEKVRALDMGADDYITKPFGLPELLARIRTAVRHSIRAEAGLNLVKLSVGGLVVDFNRHTVFIEGRDCRLTQNEFKIVSILIKHSGHVIPYSYLIEQVWGRFAAGDRQILRVNMANIRRKIERNPADPRYILTETGVGYRMPGGSPGRPPRPGP